LTITPITIAGSSLGFTPAWLFFLSAIAIIPLAKFIGDATEELSAKSGPALGGLLNATFGNAPELLIGTFALREGLIEVVKASITGSLIGNLLLVLGTAIFAGGARYKTLTFNRSAAQASSSTLLLAVIAMTVPAIFFQTSPSMERPVATESLSVYGLLFEPTCIFIWPKWSLTKPNGASEKESLYFCWRRLQSAGSAIF
jgi:Ca2+:H+ antiporter